MMSHHLMRCLMAGVILYLFSMEWVAFTRKAAPGGIFAGTVMECCYWFLTMLGGVHFSTAITEEVEEQTLPLLKMTGASSFSILTGKSLPRLGVAVLFLLCAMPFLVLALTLGGVLPLGLASAVLGIVCYAVMLSQLGLLCSVVCRNGKQAFMLTSIGWVAFELCHWWYEIFSGFFSFALRGTAVGTVGTRIMVDWLPWIPSCSLFGNMTDSLLAFDNLNDVVSGGSWFAWIAGVTTAVVKFHMGAHLLMAVVFFLISWRLFEPMTTRFASRGDSTVVANATRSTARRATGNAVAWKAHEFTTGGRFWFLLRIFVLPAIILTFVASLEALGENVEPVYLAIAAMYLGAPFLIINASRLLGSIFTDEIHGKTLPSLIMLPQSTQSTAASMVRGLIPAILASPPKPPNPYISVICKLVIK